METPVLPDPARRPAESDPPSVSPCPGPVLTVIAGGGQVTADRADLQVVPDPGAPIRPRPR